MRLDPCWGGPWRWFGERRGVGYRDSARRIHGARHGPLWPRSNEGPGLGTRVWRLSLSPGGDLNVAWCLAQGRSSTVEARLYGGRGAVGAAVIASVAAPDASFAW